MKILYLSKALVVGAYQTKMEALAAQPDVELVAAVPPAWKDERGTTMLERAHTEGYTLRVTPISFNGSYHLHFYPSIGKVLDEVQPDLFHIDEEAYNLATFHAAWAAHRRSIPYLFFTWQNLLRHYPPPFRWMESWVFDRAAYAIAGNEDATRVLAEKGYRGPARVIPQFGVDLRLFQMRDLSAAPTARPMVIGYAGRLIEDKGIHILLQALAGLEHGNWKLEIRGSGPGETTLRKEAARLGLQENVFFRPLIPSTEMGRFYNAVDIFVLPSLTRPHWKEQFGRVLVEAMASGVVVVGSSSGEIPHVIGDAGVVVQEGDIESLRGALRLLLSDHAMRRKLAEAGRERVIHHFTQDAIAARTATLYRELLHAPHGTASHAE